MKKIFLGVAFIILTLFACSSCGFFGPQQYVCNVEDVESAQIIRLGEPVKSEYRYEYTVLAEISDVEVFVDQLNNLKHSVNWGEPGVLKPDIVVIRVNYLNGDYDMIHTGAQWFHRSGVNNTGYFFFDQEEFDALISTYWKH